MKCFDHAEHRDRVNFGTIKAAMERMGMCALGFRVTPHAHHEWWWGENRGLPAHSKAIRFPSYGHAHHLYVEVQVPHHLLDHLQQIKDCDIDFQLSF